MEAVKNKNRSRMIAAAMQKIPCDLTIENVKFVNVITGEIYPASVDILDGIVIRVREEGETTTQPSKEIYDAQGRYMVPGFFDTHLHVESTMMVPENFARAVARCGSTTVVTDPHEIGNVLGFTGVKALIDAFDWDFCQIQFNYMDEHSQAGIDGLNYAHEKGLPVIIMEPLRGGRLAGGLPRDARKEFEAVRADRSPAEWGLRWIWNHPQVTVVLSGMNDVAQVEENCRVASESLPDSLSGDGAGRL